MPATSSPFSRNGGSPADCREIGSCGSFNSTPDSILASRRRASCSGGFGSSPVQNMPLMWLRSFGGPIILCCVAFAGFVVLFMIGLILLLSDEDPPAAPQVPTIIASPPQMIHAGGVGTESHLLAGALDQLRRDMQSQERARQQSEDSLLSQLRRLGRSGVTASSQDMAANYGADFAAHAAGGSIDHAHTSESGRGVLGRLKRLIVLVRPGLRETMGPVLHPPEVALAADSSPPSRCFVLQDGGSVAIRLGKSVRPTHVALEKPPPDALLAPKSMPRRFEVYVWRASEGARPYGELVGKFQYELDGPRTQFFDFGSTLPEKVRLVRGVKFVFLGNWGEDFTSVCRLRVFGDDGE